MIFKAEITIDLDAHRRIWIQASANADPKDATAPAVIAALTESVTEQGLNAYEAASARTVISDARGGIDSRSPSERPKRPDDPETMRTMQED